MSRQWTRQASSMSEDPKTARKREKFGEAVGVTAAECAAVCCCCPCSILELLVLVLYKVPTRLCKKAWRWKKRHAMKRKKNPDSMGPTKQNSTREELEAEMDLMLGKGELSGVDGNGDSCTKAAENQMWDQFRMTGFWRSPSQTDR